MMELLGYFLALFVGISLGLIGGGGSILAMPILVYIFHLNPQLATSYSLFFVGISALIGSIKHYNLNNLNLDTAFVFGIPSIISLLITRKFILPQIPNVIFIINEVVITKNILLMIVFAVLMIAASISMIRNKKNEAKINMPSKNKLAFVGFMVGIVTGLLGAGGGFLIIPALIFFAALPMKQAVGTSLFIIAVNAMIGFIGDLINNVHLNFQFLMLFSTIAIIGIFIGTHLSKKIDGNKLKPAFAWFVLVAGIYIIAKEIFF
jgi:uncharacterized membrane protein YfcA